MIVQWFSVGAPPIRAFDMADSEVAERYPGLRIKGLGCHRLTRDESPVVFWRLTYEVVAP